MPSKEHIQQLLRLFTHFKLHGGRNKPSGVSQVELVDDDDLTHWFVQLLYKDENAVDFYVSLELVFSEDGADEGPADAFNPDRRATLQSGVEGYKRDAALKETALPPTPPSQRAPAEQDDAVIEDEKPRIEEPCSKHVDSDANRRFTSASSTVVAAATTTTTTTTSSTNATASCRKARMPLVFIVAPRLIAAFIHHGALCSLELMSQYWEPTPDNMSLLLIALHETLNPFSGDGRVSVDDAERTESRRAAVAAARGLERNPNARDDNAAAGVAGGGLPAPGAYSAEEHQMGMDFIRRAHPHLFRRHVDPSPIDPAAAAVDGGVVRSGPPTSSVTPQTVPTLSASPSCAPHAGATKAVGSPPACASPASPSTPAASQPHILRDVSRLNTAIYDAMVYAYSTSTLSDAVDQRQAEVQQPTAARRPQVRMLLDSAALLADANAIDRRHASSDLRGTPAAVKTEGEEQGDVEGDDARPASSPLGLSADQKSKTASALCTPALHAERVLRERPPAASHLAYAPTQTKEHRDRNGAHMWNRGGGEQRVMELWIPRTLPQLPAPTVTTAALSPDGAATPAADPSAGHDRSEKDGGGDAGGLVSPVMQLIDERTHAAPLLCSLDVYLVGDVSRASSGDTEADVAQAPMACVLRNMRVSAGPPRALISSTRLSNRHANSSNSTTSTATNTATVPVSVSTAATTETRKLSSQGAAPSFRFSLQPSTAPSPRGEVHVCEVPAGLSLRCENLYLYGHLRVLGSLTLHNCILVGSITAEEFASVQVTQGHLALMPDDRLLRLALPPLASSSASSHAGVGRKGDGAGSGANRNPKESPVEHLPPLPPPPQPALFYGQRKECLLVLDSSKVEVTDDSRLYRLMRDTGTARLRPQRRRCRHDRQGKPSREPRVESGEQTEKETSESESESDGAAAVTAAAEERCPAAMTTVLRSLILVSNQGRLRLVRCSVHPGRHTERTIFAEQDAIVDMAYCSVVTAMSSAVIVQGCRAFLDHCTFEGNTIDDTHTTTAAAAAQTERNQGSDAHPRDDGDVPPPAQPPIRLGDVSRSTGLIVELGGTLTARFCAARHVYFAYCVIAHSVAHLYRCSTDNVVNGYTIDASSATLDGCSANTNHVGVFVLRKAKCIITDDNCGSFVRRCTRLGTAYDAAHRAVLTALREQRQQQKSGAELLGGSPAAVAARTTRVAALARQYYADYVLHPDAADTSVDATAARAAAAAAEATTPPLGLPSGSTGWGNETRGSRSDVHPPPRHFGIYGGSFSLEVRDAALKASGITLMNARDTAVYAVDDSTVELEDCVLWSTVEVEDAATNAAVAAAAAAATTAAAAAAAAEEEHVAAPGDAGVSPPLKPPGRDGDATAAVKAAHATSPTLKSSPRPSVGPRQSSCGIKTVHSALTARRCFIAGFSFGVGAIQSSTAALTECMAAHCMNGFTVDHSTCHLTDCGADTRHVGIFVLNNAEVEVVGVASLHRASPRRICGGLPAVFCGDAYGVECKASAMRCYGITVRRGRDSGINVYNKSQFTLQKSLIDMSPAEAEDPVARGAKLEKGNTAQTELLSRQSSGSSNSDSDSGSDSTASQHRRRKRGVNHLDAEINTEPRANEEDDPPSGAAEESGNGAAAPPSPLSGDWLRSLTLDVDVEDLNGPLNTSPRHNRSSSDRDSSNSSSSNSDHEATMDAAAAAGTGNHSSGSNAKATASAGDSPSAPAAPAFPTSAARNPPPAAAVLTSGVKVWSGSRCYVRDSEVRCVTFGFAALGPETTLEAHHCTSKHVVNGFTADGGAMQLTMCSANSSHVGVYVLSQGRCLVRRGSYMAKKYGIECRSGVVSFQGHVKIHGFSRIGLYLYAGAHGEADSDSVLDIHVHKPPPPSSVSPPMPAAREVGEGDACETQHCGRNAVVNRMLPQSAPARRAPPPLRAPPPPPSLCGVEEAANVSDLLPACIALDEATAHLTQAILGGGACCGITCADGATGYIGKCILHDCTLVGVNVFSGAHLTLTNCLLQCARRYAVVVHVGGVCLLNRQSGEGERSDQDDDNAEGAAAGEAAAADEVRRRGTVPNTDTREGGSGGSSSRFAGSALLHAWQRLWGALRRTVPAASFSAATSRKAIGDGSHPTPRTHGAARRLSAYVDGGATTLSLLNAAMAVYTAASTRECSVEKAGDNGCQPCVGEEELGGHRRLPLSRAARQHLRWMRLERHRVALPFLLNALADAGEATAAVVGDAGESLGYDVNSNDDTAGSPAHTLMNNAGRSTPNASPPLLPPVQPAIMGHFVIRGTCTIARLLLQPTPLLPSLQAANEKQSQSAAEPEKTEAREEEDAALAHSEEKEKASGAADGAPPSVSLAQTLPPAPPAIHVCQHGALTLADCLIDASFAAPSDVTPDPQHPRRTKLGKPPGSSAASAVVVCDGPYARLHCDYVRVLHTGLHSSTHAKRNSSGNDLRSSPVASLNSGAEESVLQSAHGSPAQVPTAAEDSESTADEPSSRAVGPLVFLSLQEGAQCTLHMVGASLDQWPYSAYAPTTRAAAAAVSSSPHPLPPHLPCVDPAVNTGTASFSGDPNVRNLSNASGAEEPRHGDDEGEGGVKHAEPPPPHTHDPGAVIPAAAFGSDGITLCVSKDSLVEASFSVFTGVRVGTQAIVRLVHCVIYGECPTLVRVRHGSRATLLFCRVLSTHRGDPRGGAAAAIHVDATSHLTLFRSEVRMTASHGEAVKCVEGGRVGQLQSAVTSLDHAASRGPAADDSVEHEQQ